MKQATVEQLLELGFVKDGDKILSKDGRYEASVQDCGAIDLLFKQGDGAFVLAGPRIPFKGLSAALIADCICSSTSADKKTPGV